MATKLYTLTDVKELTGISLPTLQKYKKNYQDRIPSVGEGRTQRYPAEALAVFEQLKKENLKKRGRPRKKSKAEAPSIQLAAASVSSGDLLTLKEVANLTGISYPTLARYSKTSLPRIPHEGRGRKRRYRPEAVGVFKTLYEESKRGRRRKSGPSVPSAKSARRIAPVAESEGVDLSPILDLLKELQKSQRDLQRQVERLEKEVHRPYKVTLRRA